MASCHTVDNVSELYPHFTNEEIVAGSGGKGDMCRVRGSSPLGSTELMTKRSRQMGTQFHRYCCTRLVGELGWGGWEVGKMVSSGRNAVMAVMVKTWQRWWHLHSS